MKNPDDFYNIGDTSSKNNGSGISKYPLRRSKRGK